MRKDKQTTIITEKDAEDIYRYINPDWDETDSIPMIDFFCDVLGYEGKMLFYDRLEFRK